MKISSFTSKVKRVESLLKEDIMFFQRYIFGYSILTPVLFFILKRYSENLKFRGAHHQSLEQLTKQIRFIDENVYNFCQAEIYYYQGKLAESLELLKLLKAKNKQHIDTYYLSSKVFSLLDEHQKANNELYEVLKFSKRKKTWLLLANLVNTESDYNVFKNTFLEKVSIKTEEDLVLLNYFTEAALKVKKYNDAKKIWIEAFNLIYSNNWSISKTKKFFNINNAQNALIDLDTLFNEHNIPFFLVSGTLLGCVRNNSILPHDKDLDIGIFAGAGVEKLVIQVILNSGYFEILPTRTNQQLKVKHLNGTYIDVFYHTTIEDKVWHYTAKIKWYNTVFKLKKCQFLGRSFDIPANVELYLEENYGKEWETPKVNFDSSFDTPNSVVTNVDEMEVFCIKALSYEVLHGSDLKSDNIMRLVENLSEEVVSCLSLKEILKS